MKVEVNYDVCEANGLCELAAPEYFRLEEDDTLTLLRDDVATEFADKVREAVDRCPKVALALREG